MYERCVDATYTRRYAYNVTLSVLSHFAGKMKWEKPMVSGVPPPPMESHNAILLGSRMLVFGGWNRRGESFNELYFFDTSTASDQFYYVC